MRLYGSVVPSYSNFGFTSTVLLLKSDPSVLLKLTRSFHCLHQFFIFCASEHATWAAVHIGYHIVYGRGAPCRGFL